MDNEDKHGNELKSFYDALTNLDTKLVDDACKNSLAWFTKKKMSHEVALNFYQPNIRYSTDKDGEILTQYAPRFKVKIPVRYGRVDCAVWRDLPYDLSGWISDDLLLLDENVLQLECEFRGLETGEETSEHFVVNCWVGLVHLQRIRMRVVSHLGTNMLILEKCILLKKEVVL